MKTPLLILAMALCAPLTSHAAPITSSPTKAKPSANPAKALKPPTSQADPLDIPAFAGVPNEFTFAGTQKDLLGMVQSFAKGIKVEGAKPVSPNMSGATQLFSDSDFLDMLSNIHVLRARSLSFRSRGDKAYDEALKEPTSPAKAPVEGKILDDPLGLQQGDKAYDREQARLGEAHKFYSQAFLKQGGQEQLSLQNAQTTISIYKFTTPPSFALLTRGPSRVIVVRADGLPQLAAIGRLFRQVMSQ